MTPDYAFFKDNFIEINGFENTHDIIKECVISRYNGRNMAVGVRLEISMALYEVKETSVNASEYKWFL